MRKIPTLFIRYGKYATPEVNPGCEWVLAGEGRATRKWDGTACLIRDGQLYKRLEWNATKGRAPTVWLHYDFDPEVRSGHGWMPVGVGPEDWMHRLVSIDGLEDGTYELCGPKIGKNPEGLENYLLIKHGMLELPDSPRDFLGLCEFLLAYKGEGIVWHHPDGCMAKLKRRDIKP